MIEKSSEGGWITLAVTALLIGLCFVIRRHYVGVVRNLRRLDEVMKALPTHPPGERRPLDKRLPTAVLLVGGYGGLGIHQLLTIQQLFPGTYKNVLFGSVGVIDSATMKGVEEVDELKRHTEEGLRRYVALAGGLGLNADYRMSIGTEAVAEAERLSLEIAKEFPRVVFFAGKLIFEKERWYQRFLHNETAYQIQRRLQFAGLNAMVLPVRVLQEQGKRSEIVAAA